MNYRPNTLKALLLACCVMTVPTASHYLFAQSTTTTSKRKHEVKKKPSIESQMEEMRQQFQTQIDQLKQQINDRDQQLQQAQTAAQQAQASAQQAQAQAQAAAQNNTQNTEAVTNLQQAVQGVKADTDRSKNDLEVVKADTAHIKNAVLNPIALEYKGVILTPGGFLAAETVRRQRATGGGLNTAFGSLPFSGSSLGQQSEFVATGRQSRISLLAEGKLDWATIGGYYEADFLSAGATSNNNESNSYTLRQRQVWGRAQLNDGWNFVGGQMWSFLTLTTSGLTNRTEAIPFTIDPQYVPGFIWARQEGFRVYKNMGTKAFFGVSAENPQFTFGGHGYANNFVLGTAGNAGGLLNPTTNYSLNLAPDIIAKVAIEPGFGHYEISGISMFLHDRVYPNAALKTGAGSGAYNDSKVAGAVEGAAWLPFGKGKVNLGVRGIYGQAIGRYGSGGLADTTVHPDGTLAPLHDFIGLFSAELHPTSKWDLYYYYGGDYAGRAAYLNSKGKAVGYGAPTFVNSGCETETAPTTSPYGPGSASKCTGDSRAVINNTAGYWYRFYKGPKGTLTYGLQYNYSERKTWAGVGGQPKAIDNMFWTSFRYYIP